MVNLKNVQCMEEYTVFDYAHKTFPFQMDRK